MNCTPFRASSFFDKGYFEQIIEGTTSTVEETWDSPDREQLIALAAKHGQIILNPQT